MGSRKKILSSLKLTCQQKKLNYKQSVKMSQNFSTTEILSTVQISGKSQTFSLFYDESVITRFLQVFLNRFSP